MANEQLTDIGSQIQEPAAISDPSQETAEKLLRQSQVNNLVGHAKSQAYEKGKRDAMAELSNQAPQIPPQSMGGVPQLSEEQLSKMVAEHSQKHLEKILHEQQMAAINQHHHQVAHEFTQKLNVGKEKYPDWDTTTKHLDYVKFPDLVRLTHGLDNTADVLYDLAKNPHKVAAINGLLINPATHEMAFSEVQKLSNSIKNNELAAQQPSVNEPLSQLKSSSIGTDNGSYTVRDFRNKYRG